MAARGGGGGGPVIKLFTFIFVMAIVVAFLRIPGHQTAGGLYGYFDAKMQTVQSWVTGLVDQRFGLGDLFNGNAVPKDRKPGSGSDSKGKKDDKKDKGGDSGSTDTSALAKSLDKIKQQDAQNVAYNRDDWKHWDNIRSCWNVREEVLYRDAVKGSIELTDKDGKKVTNKDKACNIVKGKWIDPFSGKTYTNPKDIDIDHVIPLKYAATHGGQQWSSSKKREYANSLAPGHLLAVSASQNRSKGDKGPGSWKPSDKSYHCTYARQWISIATTWKLSLNPADHKELGKMLAKC